MKGLPETHAFLKRLRARVDGCGRDVLLIAEAIQPVKESAPYLADDELHAAFDFALTAHLFAAVAHGRCAQLRSCLEHAQAMVPGCRWALPLRNHDELWLGDGHLVEDAVVQTVLTGFPNAREHWLNWGINRRLAPLLNGDPRPNTLLHALLYSLPGLPCLYYGDELGMGDWPGLRDRDPNRTPMAWTGDRNGGFSTAPDPLLVLPPITTPGYDYRVVNVDVQQHLSGSLINWHHRMLTSRRILPALRHGSFELLKSNHPSVLCYARSSEGMTVVVAANLGATGASTRLDLGRWSGSRVREVLAGCEFPKASGSLVCLPAGLWILLVAGGRGRPGVQLLIHQGLHRRPQAFALGPIHEGQPAATGQHVIGAAGPLMAHGMAHLGGGERNHVAEGLKLGRTGGAGQHVLRPQPVAGQQMLDQGSGGLGQLAGPWSARRRSSPCSVASQAGGGPMQEGAPAVAGLGAGRGRSSSWAAASNPSRAIGRQVVHLPPITLTSPQGRVSTTCSRTTVEVWPEPPSLRSSGRPPAQRLLTTGSVRPGNQRRT